MSFITKIFGDPNEKTLKEIRLIIDRANGLEGEIKGRSDEELKSKTFEFREEYNKKTVEERDAFLNEIIPEVFAIIREMSLRKLGMRHYDSQLIGGVVLHRGQIAEMKTGEGKTLVATAPVYLNAITGRGVHVITVNDYLASRDAGWMAGVYHALGLTTGVIIHDGALLFDPEYIDEAQKDPRLMHFKKVSRQEAYRADITYGTNNEFGFDYLRDNMVPALENMVQRELHFAIVDEVDSILIDEARTPLIISAPAEESTDKYYKFAQLVKNLVENEDYNVDEKMRAVTLTEVGLAKMEKWLGVENIYVEGGMMEVHHIEQALKAQVLFKNDRDYVVKDGEIIIVDEFTGRLMYGRRYSEGLHQAIEAKEDVTIQRESETLATITFQNLFRLYKKLSGMTGTAVTEAEEFSKIYSLETVVIPTNKPNQRKDLNDLIYKTEIGKFQAVIRDAKERSLKGQPVLIGTISIEKNEILSDMMAREGVQVQILNAKNHKKEAEIIADAGKRGAVTLATNMAGRGVDIILGGADASKEEQEEIKALGGLHVIGTERHESRRIDNQLRGRSGRQGDPGSTQFFVSMEDDLMRIFGGEKMKNMMTALHVPEDMPIENKLVSRSIESAQKRVEGNNFDIRKHLVEYDDVMNKHREFIYRKRREILEFSKKSESENKKENEDKLSDIVLEMVDSEIEQVVSFHTASDDFNEWNLEEISQVVSTIFPVKEDVQAKLKELAKSGERIEKAESKTKLIEYLFGLAKTKYEEIKQHFSELGIDWQEFEKGILIRSIDTLWIEHLEAMSHMRQGIGLRGYGQRDPLVEYKKEAYYLYNELNSLITKQVVYSIYKVGGLADTMDKEFRAPNIADRAKQFSAPAKTMDASSASFSSFKKANSENKTKSVEIVKEKPRDAEGNKVGRNDTCPCGSGKKFKKCHGK